MREFRSRPTTSSNPSPCPPGQHGPDRPDRLQGIYYYLKPPRHADNWDDVPPTSRTPSRSWHPEPSASSCRRHRQYESEAVYHSLHTELTKQACCSPT